MGIQQRITPFLWFDSQAEEAANYYVSVFPNSGITKVVPVPEGGRGPVGKAMTVQFTLDGMNFVALNGGPHFKFTEAVSFVVSCQTQAELDDYWQKLSADGRGQCGWTKDRFGLSWQIVPAELPKLLSDPARAGKVMKAVMTMEKLDIPTLQRAYDEA